MRVPNTAVPGATANKMVLEENTSAKLKLEQYQTRAVAMNLIAYWIFSNGIHYFKAHFKFQKHGNGHHAPEQSRYQRTGFPRCRAKDYWRYY